MLVFAERGKLEYPEKNLSPSREENQQQTQPTYDIESGNRTRATLEEGECSHHCAIPAPLKTLHERTFSIEAIHKINLPFNMYCTEGESVQSGGSQDGWEVSRLDRDLEQCVLT